MIWDPKHETMSRQEMRQLQTQRMIHAIQYCYDHSPFYHKRFQEIGLRPEQFKSLDDLKRIPFTVKADLRDNYPFGMFAVPQKRVVRIHASSGTTGKPTVVGYTQNDLEMWKDVMARLICATGVTDDDVAQVAFGYGMFTGALGLHNGLEKVGCAVVPASAGNTQRQLMMMQDFGTTVLIATPSYALYLAEAAEEAGLVMGKDLKLRVGLFGGEGHSDRMHQDLERRLGILATENYGLSEVLGPGVAGDCYCQCGMHINEDHFYPEIIDPDTEEVLPMGEEGELVLTAMTKEALPILRYRTKDITRLIEEPCKCGRTTLRMEKIHGRADDMLIIRGVNVFPTQIEEVLSKFPALGANYEIIVSRDGYLDKMEIKAELVDASLLERFAELEGLTRSVHDQLKAALLLDAKIRLVQPQSLKRFEGKAKRVTDLRNEKYLI
ncbi:MAG: phenylacetate--CoA ligase [Eubacteriales bacterium]|nr:phenylacetate--CoA ligase [Eubacteriales bacterium]